MGISILLPILIISMIGPMEATGSDGHMLVIPDGIIPLSTQVPLSFEDFGRDSNNDIVDDMLDDPLTLDIVDGYFGMNVHMDRPVDRYHVKDILERADSIGMEPEIVRVGKYTTSIYLLVKPPTRGDISDLISPSVSFIEYRPMMIPFLDVSSRTVRATSSEEMSPLTASDLGISGEGITVAVLDSGVDNNLHESLRGKYRYGVDFTGTTAIYGIDPDDVDGHGTHVAGTVLGTGGNSETYMGTAPGASLVDLKIFKAFGSILGNSDEAFEWILENHEEREIKVAQCSFGSSITTAGKDTTAQLANMLVDEGIAVVVAVGNDGSQGLPSPASADKVITVGAYNDKGTIARNDDNIEGFSNRGPRASDGDLDPMDELKPDLGAPGRDIRAPEKNSILNYVEMTGTSMACPHVSGIAALMFEAAPEISPEQIRSIFRDTAQQGYGSSRSDLDPKYNYLSGWGEIDAYGAVKRALDLGVVDISSPKEVESGSPVEVKVSGRFTKTTYDTTLDTIELELATPYSWGRPTDMNAEPGLMDADASIEGPERSGDRWITTMISTFNSSVDEVEPSLTVSIIPMGDNGDSAVYIATTEINGILLATETREVNITDGPSPPDLSITPLSIWFSDPLPDGGDIIDITVRVNNSGGRSVDDALIRLLDGPERTGVIIGEISADIPSGSYFIAEFSWEANPGIHAITAIADPDGTVVESDESNNSAEKPITVRGFNPPPVAQLDVYPEQGTTTTIFSFDGSGSQDTNIRGGDVVSYLFEFGDGTSSDWINEPQVGHRYIRGGTYTASLTVRDNGGEESSNDAEVTMNVTAVSSLRETLYLNGSYGLSNDPGHGSSIPVNDVFSQIGEWSSEPFMISKVLHSFMTVDLRLSSPSRTTFQYSIELIVPGSDPILSGGSVDLEEGEGSLQVDLVTDEIEIKTDGIMTIRISGSASGDGSDLIIGPGGSFIDYLYYLPSNTPPVVDAGGDIEVRAGSPVSFIGTAEDADGDVVLVRWDVDGDGTYEVEGEDAYSYDHPGFEEEGTYDALFEAKDDSGIWSSDTLKVMVRPSDYNFPPEVAITCGPDQTISGRYMIRGSASDEERVEKVEISIGSDPDDISVLEWTEANGEEEWDLEWDTRQVEDGSYMIKARSFDGRAFSDVETCPVNVSNPNTGPIIIDISVSPLSFVAGQDLFMLITATVDDPDLPSDELDVSVDLSNIGGPPVVEMFDDGEGPDHEEGDGIHSTGFEPSSDVEPGIHRLFFEAEDSKGGIDQAFLDITVMADISVQVRIIPRDVSTGDEVLIEVDVDVPMDVTITATSEVFGSNRTVLLTDDGIGGDKVLGDSIHSGNVVIDGGPGSHAITITIMDDRNTVLHRQEETIRISGSTADPGESGSSFGISIPVVISGLVILFLVMAIVVVMFMVRKNDEKRYQSGWEPPVSQPVLVEVIEEEVLEGELPIHGQMPGVSEGAQTSYQEGMFDPE